MEELIKQYNDLQKQMTKKVCSYLFEQAKPIFDKYPQIETIGWNQWAPYFNDGEACVFSVYTDTIYLNNEDADYIEDNIETADIHDFGSMLENIPTNIMETITEDGRVSIHRDGKITIEYVSHD